MATTVTAAHNSICGHLYDSMHAAEKPTRELKFVTLDKKRNMSRLWRREKFLRICSKEDLAEKAQNIEVTIPVEKSQEARHYLDPGSFFVNRSWGRRPDGLAINGILSDPPRHGPALCVCVYVRFGAFPTSLSHPRTLGIWGA